MNYILIIHSHNGNRTHIREIEAPDPNEARRRGNAMAAILGHGAVVKRVEDANQ